MAETNFNNILRDIRNRVFHPIYFLMGEESFYIDVIADYIEAKVLSETEKEFNLSILYGKDTDIPTILSTARRYPMMASHNIVIIREAQHINDMDGLLPYLEKPLNSTILVINYKYKILDRRSKLYKALDKSGQVFIGKKLYDNQVPDWIASYAKKHAYRIGPKATQLLADHLGTDLGKIVNEVRKLFINLEKGSEITTAHIEENIGISKDFNFFELQNALGERNSRKVFQIARYFAENPKSSPLIMTTTMLYGFFSKLLQYHSLQDKSQHSVARELGLNPFFVKDYALAARNYSPGRIAQIMGLLRSYDLRSKGLDNASTDHGELTRELCYKILN